jgi:hypothetical protein
MNLYDQSMARIQEYLDSHPYKTYFIHPAGELIAGEK